MNIEFPLSHGAGAYLSSSRWKLSAPWITLCLLITIEFALWYQESQLLIIILFWTIAISISLNAVFLGLESKVIAAFFKSHPKSGRDISDPDWQIIEFTGWAGSELKGYFLKSKGDSRGLILYMHGYSSSLGRAEERILHLRDQGFDIAAIEMRGHGRCDLNHDWTLLKVATDNEAFLDRILAEYKDKPAVHFYGHSMGGFLAMRLSARKSGWWADNLISVILESPVASIPMLVKAWAGSLWNPSSFLIRRIIRKEAERIHPDLPVRFMDAKVPQIGLPNIPVLILQSKDDEALGRSHYNLVKKHLDGNSENKFHLITDLAHTTTLDSTNRKKLLENWLNERR